VAQNEAHTILNLYGWVDSQGLRPGWYAQDGARLMLPPLTNITGTTTVRWGDTIDDLTVNATDLVNSVTLDFSAVTGGDLALSLLATNRADNNVLYPDTVVGIWAFDGSAFNFGSGNVTPSFRYDHLLAQAKGLAQGDLKVWIYDNGWRDITAAIDATEKTITAKPIRLFSTIAISAEVPGKEAPRGTLISIR